MARPKILILMPVFNDWPACSQLIQEIDDVVSQHAWDVQVIAIDDGSISNEFDPSLKSESLQQVEILRLKRNLGHQRAICIGLSYANENWEGDAIVIMDGDGQDGASDIPTLLKRALEDQNKPVVFAARQRRAENLLFRFFYVIYKTVHYLLTGHHVRVGNFSAFAFSRLRTLCVFPDLWNHYAATVFKSKLPRVQIPIDRRIRSEGRSRMNFVGLVVHGLSAMSVFGETIGVRLLMLASGMAALAFLGGVIVSSIRVFTDWAIPGWATYTVIGMLIVGIQAMLLMVVFTFVVLSARNGSFFLPIRDYRYFVDRLETWNHRDGQ